MKTPLKLLIVEDSERDATLILRELENGGYEVAHERVDTEDGMREAIGRQSWDVVISDFSMPQFDALRALEVVTKARIETPFIILSGSIGEETAVEAMRLGARDFVLKGNMKRLLPAVARELNTARMKRDGTTIKEKLKFERLLLQQIIDSSPDAISIKDREQHYIYLNDAERLTLDAKKAQDASISGGDLVCHARAEDENRVLETGEPVFDSVETIMGSDGSMRWMSATRAPIFDSRGDIVGIVAIARDITEKKRQERLKDEFIATVNHELRTPITCIVGALRLIDERRSVGDEAGGAMDNLFKIALQNGQRLATIVNDILDFEAIQSGKMRYKKSPIDVADLVAKTIEANQVLARTNGVRLRQTGTTAQGVLTTDPDRLAQVITNLLSNAIKFSPSGSEVTIAIGDFGKSVQISVQDHGPGIPAEYVDRIFERFVQVDGTNTRKQGGTGLGLSISKQIMQQLGGDIRVKTVLNEGSTFQVTIPAVS